jgi:hypothetical protein
MNKPMVFLSHSKKDIDFIHNLDSDLRRCGIETWLDEIDIRHGESWINEIFENGIAKCDFVLVYITDSSIKSAMVSKEIDSAIVSQLHENRVKLLLYVDSDTTRDRLRLDLRSIHCPLFNQENYCKVMPTIVSSIWKNHMDAILARVISEKDMALENYRLKEELNEQKKSFLSELDEEFSFMYEELNSKLEVRYGIKNTEGKRIDEQLFVLNKLDVVTGVYYNIDGVISKHSIESWIIEYLKQKSPTELRADNLTKTVSIGSDLMNNFITFGFVGRHFNPKSAQNSESRGLRFLNIHNYEVYLKSEKFDKFNFWLRIKKKKIDRTIENRTNA